MSVHNVKENDTNYLLLVTNKPPAEPRAVYDHGLHRAQFLATKAANAIGQFNSRFFAAQS